MPFWEPITITIIKMDEVTDKLATLNINSSVCKSRLKDIALAKGISNGYNGRTLSTMRKSDFLEYIQECNGNLSLTTDQQPDETIEAYKSRIKIAYLEACKQTSNARKEAEELRKKIRTQTLHEAQYKQCKDLNEEIREDLNEEIREVRRELQKKQKEIHDVQMNAAKEISKAYQEKDKMRDERDRMKNSMRNAALHNRLVDIRVRVLQQELQVFRNTSRNDESRNELLNHFPPPSVETEDVPDNVICPCCLVAKVNTALKCTHVVCSNCLPLLNGKCPVCRHVVSTGEVQYFRLT